MKQVQIKVLRCGYDPELAERYLTDGREAGPCPIQSAGQVFVYRGGAVMPEGLCPWAWIDLYRTVASLSAEAKNDWFKPNVRINCCTDGIRPVVYELTALDEDVTE